MEKSNENRRRESTWLFWACTLVIALVAFELGRDALLGDLRIRVEGNLSPDEREQLHSLLAPYVKSSALWLDSEDFVKDVGSLPWVGAVEVHPTGLGQATVKVSHSLAERLSRPERTLVNALSDLVRASETSLSLSREALELDRRDRHQMAGREFVFLAFNVMLEELGLHLEAVDIHPSGHIELALEGGKTLVLGSARPLARLRRFARVYQSDLAPEWDGIERVDARYRDAVAVRMAEHHPRAGRLVAGNFGTAGVGEGR